MLFTMTAESRTVDELHIMGRYMGRYLQCREGRLVRA